MTASNLAVCLAPSLFHMTVSSPLRRKNTTGSPEQKDLHDNKAARTCLTMMIQKVGGVMGLYRGCLTREAPFISTFCEALLEVLDERSFLYELRCRFRALIGLRY